MHWPARLRRREATVAEAGPVDDRNQRYDAETVELIRRVFDRRSVGIDVGAHEGSILAHMVNAAPDAGHVAFEPIPELAARLRERFPMTDVHEVALSAESGFVEFHHVVSNPGYSGLRRRRYDRPSEEVVIARVRTARLDDELDVKVPIRLVKVDVEGGELGVLQGGSKLLTLHRPYIVFEHGLGASDYYGTTPDDMYSSLDGFGLSVTLMERWLAGAPDLSREEFRDEFVTGRNYYFLAYART